MAVTIIGRQSAFPDPRSADAEGLVAVGGDLSVPRLLAAYRAGIFPWTVAPVTWWCPDPRGIFELERFHVPRTLARVVRQGIFRVTYDHAFRQVMEGCAQPRTGSSSTWITAGFLQAYSQLHQQGYAHSIECWQNGRLAGGIYGVAIGGFFAGESMFYRRSNASKVALYFLTAHLRQRGYVLFDIQMITPVTQALGAITISRQEYLRRLSRALTKQCSFAPAHGNAGPSPHGTSLSREPGNTKQTP
jgi:leucyl/phenylalanyl-tRNA--protein transferase